MLSVSSLIEFLLNLLRSDDARAEFEQDPDGVLLRSGLDGITAQDVRDVAPLLADRDGVSVRHVAEPAGGRRASDGDDNDGDDNDGDDNDGDADRAGYRDDGPVREIHQVTKTYHAQPDVVVHNHTYNEYNEYNVTYEDNRVIDDRDIDGDNNTVIEDSFNQDNDGVDNKGATITDSVVAGGDVADSGNDNDGFDNDGVVVDSLNQDDSTTSSQTVVTESFNADESETAYTQSAGADARDEDGIDLDVTGRTAAENPYGAGSAAAEDDLVPAGDSSSA